MDRKLTSGALLALCAAVLIRLLVPEAPGLVRRRIGELLEGGRGGAAVFAKSGDGRGTASPLGRPDPGTERPPAEVGVSYTLEEAANAGEYPGNDAPERPDTQGAEAAGEELPEAVAAFLERQRDYAGWPLPDNVAYAWPELPFAYGSPVDGGSSSGFGFRTHPILGEIKFHYGTDFAAFSGENVLAFAEGEVRFAGSSDSYGNYIVLDHDDGWSSLYAHCSYLYAEAGQRVEKGEKIALVGATGLVTGPHLHFELSRDGVYYNPEFYVNG